MTARAAVGLLTLTAVAACGFSGEPPAASGEAEEGSAGTPRPAVVDLTPVSRFEGLFFVDDGWRFAPCGEEPIPVEGPAIPELLGVYEELVPETDEGMFVDLLGQVRERDGRGWLEAMELRRAHYEGFGCYESDPGARLVASGTEPFWTLTVLEGTVSWTTPSSSTEFRHDGLGRTEEGSWAVRAIPVNDPGSSSPALLLDAWPEPCRNAMSGAYSHLQVEVTLDGDIYRGCAHLGAEYEAGLE